MEDSGIFSAFVIFALITVGVFAFWKYRKKIKGKLKNLLPGKWPSA